MIWGKGGIAFFMSQGKSFSGGLTFEQHSEEIREMAMWAFSRAGGKCGCERNNGCKNL